MGTYIHGVCFNPFHPLFVNFFFLFFLILNMEFYRFDHPVEHGLEVAFDKLWPIEGKKDHHSD